METADKFGEFLKFFGNQKKKTPLIDTNKYGAEVVRINNNASSKLLIMVKATKLTKRALVSYAIFLLFKEFEKWKCGQIDHEFGYDEELNVGKTE